MVQLGDLYDMYSWSKFPRTQNLYTPLQELKLGRKLAENFWRRVQEASPKSRLVQLRGNHDIRPYRRILERMPEGESLLGIDHLWQFEGVETILDTRETFEWNGVAYTHGFCKHGDHVKLTRKNTVCGHLHRGGVVYVRDGKETHWEANAGWCGNPDAIPLSYTQLRKYGNHTQGYLRIYEDGPQFVHLPNP